MNYETMNAKLTGRNKDSRKLANNTYLVRKDNGNIAVRLHNTDVVTYHPNGNIFFTSGGYRTVTTKDRMNGFSPATVSQKNGHWSISMDGGSWDSRKWVDYADGITWNQKTHSWSGMGESEKSTVKTARLLRKFAGEYMVAFDAGSVPAPSNGDCWGCLMKNAAGQPVMGSGHIFEHVKEKYFVPSLLANAITRFPVSIAAKSYISDKWAGAGNGTPWTRAIGYSQVEKSLYRYLKEQTGGAA